MERIYQHQLCNGLTLLAEPVAGAQSLAMSFLLPAGVAMEPDGQQGVSALLAEMICRGAGDRDARAFSEALDLLGVDRGTSVETRYLRVGAAMIGSRATEALPLLLDMVRRPRLDENGLGPSRDLAIQAIEALQDEPQDRTFVCLRQQHLPQPFGRSLLGKRAHLEAIGIQEVRAYARKVFVPGKAVLALAGKFDWARLRDQVEQLLGDWRGTIADPPKQTEPPRGYLHDGADSTQVHIGVAFDAVPEPDPRSMTQRVAVAVLSGGMSGRLFTEVREKRGLCYAVFSRYAGDRERGLVLAYAGTTTARAQETLDVLVGELHRLSDGVQQDEFDRAKVGMKSTLVMQGESTSARASSLASDQTELGRPRTLTELAQEVDAVSLEKLNDFLAAHRPGAMTVVTIGPGALDLPRKAMATV
ncbi:MAG: insulinase family protein [Phycisphaeraceae bacterium]|nr:insulinase family protein [Phycisphaeraceae bacterium]